MCTVYCVVLYLVPSAERKALNCVSEARISAMERVAGCTTLSTMCTIPPVVWWS